MRCPPHDGQNRRRLQLKATSLIVTAVATEEAKEAVRQNTALDEGVELVFDEGRQARACGGFDLREECLGMQSVQRGQLRATTLAVNRDAIGRTVELPADGLHVLLTSRLWFFTVSDCAARRH